MLIQHDFHIHTVLSSCAKDDTAQVVNYVANAKTLGLKKLGFSNHLWDGDIPGASQWYQPQNFDHVAEIREELASATAESGIRCYFGCEVEYDPQRRDIALTEEHARAFDFILVPNSHTHMMMPKSDYEPKERHARFMLDAFMDIVTSPLAKYITAAAHPFSAVCCPYDNAVLFPLISVSQYRECFCAAREAGIAIEINTSSYRTRTPGELINHPAMEMFAIAKECGCKFTFGSDSHTAKAEVARDYWSYAHFIAGLLNLCENDLAPMVR